MDTSALNMAVARAMEPLLHSPAMTQTLQRMHDTVGGIPAAVIDTSQLRLQIAALNASMAEAMQPLLRSAAIEESTRRIRETLGAVAADAFPNAALRAITDQVTAQQSPILANLILANHSAKHSPHWSSRGVGPPVPSTAPTAAAPAAHPAR